MSNEWIKMIASVENIINRIEALPPGFQCELAFFWEQDLDNEVGFDSKLANTADELKKFAEMALIEFELGNTLKMGFDEL